MKTLNQQPDLFAEARRRVELRDKVEVKIQQVARNAEKLSPDWIENSVEAVRQYCLLHNEPFLAEEIILPVPPHDKRAMGSVIRRAVRMGFMEQNGYGLAASSNFSPKKRWQSLIFQGGAA